MIKVECIDTTLPKINKQTKKGVPRSVLKESNKINKKTTVRGGKVKNNSLQLNQSIKINSKDLREKISKLASEETKGLKYITFKEFEECKEIKKEILTLISKSKKMIVLTGAGISCNAGIPDFRSDNGLYNKRLVNYTRENNDNYSSNGNSNNNRIIIKGKEMFDISVYRSIETVRIFNKFILELYKQVLNSKPTKTHEFIKKLQDQKKLIKCYTQNIDGLERGCGLRTEFDCKEWNETNVIQLHGDLHQLCCNSCQYNYKWNEIYDNQGKIICKRPYEEEEEEEEDNHINNNNNSDEEDLLILSQNTNDSVDSINSIFSVGEVDNKSIITSSSNSSNFDFNLNENGNEDENDDNLIECPKCIDNYENKLKLGKRCLESSIGIIRPNIVLYGEEHPYSENFAKNLNKDLNKKPNIMLIFGTSLKVTGVKNLVKKMSKKIHENENGIVILINKDPISNSFWKNYIDYQIVSDCDAFCDFVESQLPNVFSV